MKNIKKHFFTFGLILAVVAMVSGCKDGNEPIEPVVDLEALKAEKQEVDKIIAETDTKDLKDEQIERILSFYRTAKGSELQVSEQEIIGFVSDIYAAGSIDAWIKLISGNKDNTNFNFILEKVKAEVKEALWKAFFDENYKKVDLLELKLNGTLFTKGDVVKRKANADEARKQIIASVDGILGNVAFVKGSEKILAPILVKQVIFDWVAIQVAQGEHAQCKNGKCSDTDPQNPKHFDGDYNAKYNFVIDGVYTFLRGDVAKRDSKLTSDFTQSAFDVLAKEENTKDLLTQIAKIEKAFGKDVFDEDTLKLMSLKAVK